MLVHESMRLFSSTCEALLTMQCEDTATESKAEICKYFDSSRGCVRGSKCFYSHDVEEHRKVKHEAAHNHSPVDKALALNRIFVGGLPSSVDSDSLGKFFEKEFGPVEDAIVILAQMENKTHSRGFGFVTFKEEKSASAAVQAHYITMAGKPVEIKSLIPKLAAESAKMALRHQEQKNCNCQSPLPAKVLSNEMIMEANKPKQGSWLDKVVHGQPNTPPQAHNTSSPKDKSMPVWLKAFKKWFPRFLQRLPKPTVGEYALSSLKSDFRASVGLELDHSHIGFSKLSDFIKSFSNLCSIKHVPIGKLGSLSHMVLLPNPRRHHNLCHAFKTPCSSPFSTPTDDGGDSKCLHDISVEAGGDSKCLQDLPMGDVGDSKCLQDLPTDDVGNSKCLQDIPTDDVGDPKCVRDIPTNDGGDSKRLQEFSVDDPAGNFGHPKEKPSSGNPEVTSGKETTSHWEHSTVLQFLKPDPVFHGRKDYDVQEVRGQLVENTGSTKPSDPQRHLVLEALTRKRNKSSGLFLREFDFYKNYKESILEGKCFACNQNQMSWANFPCQHLLWCSDCKVRAILAAGDSVHKCVVCDAQVHKLISVPRNDEFLPMPPGLFRTPFVQKTSPLMTGNR